MNASRRVLQVISRKLTSSFFVGIVIFGMGSAQLLANSTDLPSPSELQQKVNKVEGVVKDRTGEPLIGVSVVVKGTTIGTVTDIDGKYTLNLRGDNPVLEFSYIGFKALSVPANKSVINVTLEEDSKIMDEVVIVGYGAQKKENLTGAVSSVNVDKALSSRPIADVGRGLQGQVPGMNITVPTGEIGSDPVVKIRGFVGSQVGDNKPLILLDNVEIPSLQVVNPNDIESISVLKDAASASIYGSKAAYGVVLVTTKKGARTDRFEVSYSNNFSWQNRAKEIKMGGIEGLDYTVAAHENMNATMPAGGFWRVDRNSLQKIREWQDKYGSTVKAGDPVVYGRDWIYDGTNKYGYRLYDAPGAMVDEWTPTMTHSLSINGKSGKTMYNVGLGYLDQSGMLKPAKHDDFRRYNASFNISSEINKYLSIRAGAMYSDRNKRYPAVGGTSSDPWLYAYRWSPLFPVGVQENGNNLHEQIYELSTTGTDNLQNKYFNINVGATLNLTKDWTVSFDYAYDRNTQDRNSSYGQMRAGETWYAPVPWNDSTGAQIYVDEAGNPVDYNAEGAMPAYQFPVIDFLPYQVSEPYVERYRYANNKNTINLYSTYNLNLGAEKEHAFKFMAGLNSVSYDYNSTFAKRTGLFVTENPLLDFADGAQSVNEGKYWDSQLGVFGRINYAFNNKYLFEANLRYDGTSKFPKNLRWELFPSFSAGWVISNESFMEALNPVLSFAKFRASWGSIGNQNVSNTYYKSWIEPITSNKWISDGSYALAMETPSLYDANIKWERVETLDFGADLRFWRDKIGVTFDWFQRDTKDMLIRGETLPVTLGADVPYGNYGNLRTRGWEIAVDFNHRFENGLGINMMATLADATTVITKGADHNLAWEDRSLGTAYSTGRRYGDIYGYVTDRLYQKEDFVYDANGNIEQFYVVYNGTARLTNKQSDPYAVYQVAFEDQKNMVFAPGDTKYVDVNGDGYITSGSNTNGDPGDQVVIGNTTPRYEYGFRIGADYKGFDVSVFMQGIGKRDLWGAGHLAIAGYEPKEGAVPHTFATDYWTEDNTGAFYPRAWNYGGSNDAFSMKKQSRYLLDMSYFRIKNITMGYSLPQNLLKKIYFSQARVYVSLENFFTFDNLRGLPIDPETVSGYSMFRSDNNYNSGRTGMGTPTFKTVSFGMQLTF